jgi:integrase
LLGAPPQQPPLELAASDVALLWRRASAEARLVIAAAFAGIAPEELVQLRWKDVDLGSEAVRVPGGAARMLPLIEPLRGELAARSQAVSVAADAWVVADAAGSPFDEQALDTQLLCVAHDAGIRYPEKVTARTLHFTYAAFLVRQGMRMVDLSAVVGRFTQLAGSELVRIAPSGEAKGIADIERLYPAFRPAA